MPEAPPHRAPLVLRLAYAAAVLIASWYAMMAVHELGHAAVALALGGGVERIAFPIAGFSRTDLAPNPRPLLAAWAGPVVGVVLPLLLFTLAQVTLRSRQDTATQTLRFFAGFCLIANGLYLGLGWIERIGDAGDLLRHGAARWQLIAFGLICTTAGLTLWHGLGPWMGLGPKAGEVAPS